MIIRKTAALVHLLSPDPRFMVEARGKAGQIMYDLALSGLHPHPAG